MKRLWRIIYWTTVICLVLAILLIAIPKLFGAQFRAVISGSMEPEIPVGSLIVTTPKHFEDIAIGYDITYVMDEDLTVVTHRVIKINNEKETFITKGIANNIADGKSVRYENVMGTVRYCIPVIGYVFKLMDTMSGKIIAFIVIVSFMMISTLLHMYRKK